MNLKNQIFNYYGDFYAAYDSYKNDDGKGIIQRFNETLANDLDDNFLPFLTDFLNFIRVYSEIREDILPIVESSLGNIIKISDDILIRRKIIRFFSTIYKTKGTLASLKIIFYWLGFTNIEDRITERFGGLDSVLTFDDATRKFDSSLIQLDFYSLIFYGNVILTNKMLEYIINVCEWNSPINSKLNKIIFNGILVSTITLPNFILLQPNNWAFNIENTKLVLNKL